MERGYKERGISIIKGICLLQLGEQMPVLALEHNAGEAGWTQ